MKKFHIDIGKKTLMVVGKICQRDKPQQNSQVRSRYDWE